MRRALVTLAVAAVAAAAMACDKLEAKPFDSAFQDSSELSSGGQRVRATPCPGDTPAAGSTCLQSSLRCEYGADVDPRCNVFAECDGARWQRQPAAGCGGACPAKRDAIAEGAPCDAHADDRLCEYPDATCSCVPSPGGAQVWRCAPIDPACPATRPRIGEPCTAARTCDYGACVLPSGIAVRCGDDLVWLVTEPSCR